MGTTELVASLLTFISSEFVKLRNIFQLWRPKFCKVPRDQSLFTKFENRTNITLSLRLARSLGYSIGHPKVRNGA